jgi:hypothetical protein
VQRFSKFLRDVVLVEVQSPVVVFVDEIDSALGMPFTDDFFAAIRAAYNARATNPLFQRLTFILMGVARPADLIRDRNRTPYNIGTHIRLSDFTLPELHSFQTVFETVYPGQAAEIITWVLDWTNGQPYLTQKLCAEIIRASENSSTRETIAQIVTRLFFTESRNESNLRAIRDRLESSPYKTKMLQIYGQVLLSRPVLDDERSPAKNELKLIGLVRPSAQEEDAVHLEVRNRIYQTVFDMAWVRKNLPQSRTRLFAILASFLAVLAFIFAGYAIHRGRIQTSLTFVEQFQTSNSPEVKLTSLARLLELDNRAGSQADELYAGLSQEEKLSLFTGLSSPQNVAVELVNVIEAFYQENENTNSGNEILGAMKTVLGQVGAAGAPSLKTEIEFLLKGREEANKNQNALTAISFYDSAWAESVTRGHPNYVVRFDRAMALIDLGGYASAYDDLLAVWEMVPALQGEIEAVIQANSGLAAFISGNSNTDPQILALITPVSPTATVEPGRTIDPTATLPASPVVGVDPTASLTPAIDQPSPFSGWIVFGYGEGNEREIYIMNPLTGERQQVTYNGVIEESPSFSSDNWNLVYASNRSQAGWELYAYDLRRGTEQQLTSFNGELHFPAWSPAPGDARIIFEGRTGESLKTINIWMFDASNGDLEQLTGGGADGRPEWSPDGKQIVFSRALKDTNGDGRITVNDASDLYIKDLASGIEKNLTNTPDYDDFNFAWSPNGEWIVFASVRQEVNGDGLLNLSDSQDLFLIHADGSGERRLDLGGRQVFSPSWSPDGRFILVLVAEGGGQNAIWRLDTGNGNFTRVTESGQYYHPAYSNAP